MNAYEEYYDEDYLLDGDMYVDSGIEEESRILNLFHNCMVPSFIGIINSLFSVFIWNMIFRISTQTVSITPAWFFHGMSFVCGLMCLRSIIGRDCIQSLLLCFLAYFVLLFIFSFVRTYRAHTVAAIVIGFLVICELSVATKEFWHRLRGIHMIVAMKMISIGFDVDAKRLDSIPNLVEFFGYIISPANCIFGPWISYGTYITAYKKPDWNWHWLIRLSFSYASCGIFFLTSNCWSSYVSSGSQGFVIASFNVSVAYSIKWALAYHKAFSFRCSHYFVSFLSEATMATAGYYGDQFTSWRHAVSNPSYIEFPRSLVQVVAYWNIPMHKWLKKYVFKEVKHWGSGKALFVTYLISSLMHGLHFRIFVVLLSLALYTYVEFKFRTKLAHVLNACVLVQPCKIQCCHKYKNTEIWVIIANLILGSIALMQLTCLGYMFDSSDDEHDSDSDYSIIYTMEKWANINFTSLWMLFITYLIYLVL